MPSRLCRLTTLLVAALVLLCGCTRFNCTRLETILGTELDLIPLSYTIAEQLVANAQPQLVTDAPEAPVLVTTFVDNNDLRQTSAFGRTLQEHIASRLVQLGYPVREIKLAKTLHIEPRSGETILSRQLNELAEGQQTQAILVGTISRTQQVVYLSARLINPVNSTIMASADYRLCLDDATMAMFGLQRQPEADQPIEEPARPWLNSIL